MQRNGFFEMVPHKHMNLIKAAADLCMTPSAGEICKYVCLNVFGPSEHYYNVSGLLTGQRSRI